MAAINSVEHVYCVRIPFLMYGQDIDMTNWNETCAEAIEMFGLPGDKYTTRMTPSDIEFWFREEKDAMMFELCCG